MRATVDRPGLDSQGRSPLIKIRRVRKGDLSKVRDVIEQAFGDFFERQVGTRPRQVFGGAQYVHHRWLMEPWGCFVAEEGDGKIVGAAIAVMWGTMGLIGPVAVLTHYQNQDIGQQLLGACQEFFDENKATLQGVCTYAYSPRHLCSTRSSATSRRGSSSSRPSTSTGARSSTRDQARETGSRRAPLFLAGGGEEEAGHAEDPPDHERHLARDGRGQGMEIVDGLALGDTLLLEKGREVIGFAVCHMPPNSEAPHGAAYVKFLAIDGRHKKPEHLHALLASMEDMAATAQLQQVVAPVYTYYWTAYQTLLERGYHLDFMMVRMKRGKQEDYEDAADLVLDDWR